MKSTMTNTGRLGGGTAASSVRPGPANHEHGLVPVTVQASEVAVWDWKRCEKHWQWGVGRLVHSEVER